MGTFLDLTGQRFGRLTVAYRKPSREGRTFWMTRCDCGTEKIVNADHLRDGHVRSCGCLKREKNSREASIRNTTHGRSHTLLYNTWKSMKSRCHNPSNRDYKHYGARGIKVCDRWRNSFDDFFADIGDRPSSHFSLDRIDCDGDYTPHNVRWATRKTQANNRRGTPRNVPGRLAGLLSFGA